MSNAWPPEPTTPSPVSVPKKPHDADRFKKIVGFFGFCFGLVVGGVSGHIYRFWVYNHATSQAQSNNWWDLIDFWYTFWGSGIGALAGFVIGLLCVWWKQYARSKRSLNHVEL